MASWFECKIRYDKLQENGAVKKVTESFLVDALSFTEAEEIFWDDSADKWYLVKVAFITIDEKTAVEKKSTSLILVAGNDFKGAFDNFMEGMKGTMADFEIVSIAETPLMDVYKVKVKGETPEKKD